MALSIKSEQIQLFGDEVIGSTCTRSSYLQILSGKEGPPVAGSAISNLIKASDVIFHEFLPPLEVRRVSTTETCR